MNSADFDPENPENTEEGGFSLPIASNWRRAQAITIDWIGSLFVANLLLDNSWTLLFFFFQVAILTALTGSSAGQKLRGIRIIDENTLQNIATLGALIRN